MYCPPFLPPHPLIFDSWAFVDFTSTEHATAALTNPRNHQLNGRKLVVEYASPEAVRRGGGGPPRKDKKGSEHSGGDDEQEAMSTDDVAKVAEEAKALLKKNRKGVVDPAALAEATRKDGVIKEVRAVSEQVHLPTHRLTV